MDKVPGHALEDACDFRVVALLPGSLKIGVRLPDSAEQPGLWDGAAPDIPRAVQQFLDVAAWAASEAGPEALDGRFPDPEERRALLNAVKSFVPRPGGTVESLAVSGRAVPAGRPILLTRAAAPRIDGAIDRPASAQVEDHVGDLREIDLDNHSMAIRNAADVREVRCTFDESLLEAAKAALDRRVKVAEVRQFGPGRRASATLHVFRLELPDEPVPAPGPEPQTGAAVAE